MSDRVTLALAQLAEAIREQAREEARAAVVAALGDRERSTPLTRRPPNSASAESAFMARSVPDGFTAFGSAAAAS